MTDLITDFNDGVFTMAFNRPFKKNAITPEMMASIIHHLSHTAVDDSVKICVLTGAGDFYSSGIDLSSVMMSSDHSKPIETFKNLVAALIEYPKLLVAVVNGPAIGMACTTLPLFDIVYASENAYLQTPFLKLGLVAEGCSTYTFPRIFGPAKAGKLLYMSEAMHILEAAKSGLVTEVFCHQDLVWQTDLRIEGLADLPNESLNNMKRLIRNWDRQKLHDANLHETQAIINRFFPSDASEKTKSKL